MRPGDTLRYSATGTRFSWQGAQLVVEAMLQSPNFLFRLDETNNTDWKAYAAASRYDSLWERPPNRARGVNGHHWSCQNEGKYVSLMRSIIAAIRSISKLSAQAARSMWPLKSKGRSPGFAGSGQ